jgi:hypothetical protein
MPYEQPGQLPNICATNQPFSPNSNMSIFAEKNRGKILLVNHFTISACFRFMQFPAPVSPAAAARGSATFGASTGARFEPPASSSALNKDGMDAAMLGGAGEEDDDENGLKGTARGGRSQSPGPGAYNVRRFAEYPPPSLPAAAENAAALAAGAVLMTEVW